MNPNLLLSFSLLFLIGCGEKSPDAASQRPKTAAGYLGHSDSARYVGMNACKTCHQDIYNSFIQTGMGQSFSLATREKSAADFSAPVIDDPSSGYHYRAEWNGDSLQVTEYRIEGKDTIHRRSETVSYIIGSGQHTNSHIININGYLHQAPMTFYTQKKKWDLPPGFENGFNTRFGRRIGLECMSCHNAYPEFVQGSENKFRKVPMGIDCERCHGPGSYHVQERSTHPPLDTSKLIDYSIVNPAKLPVDLQFDICQRCHLQGNAVLRNDHTFFDFKPGMKLSNYLTVFMPRYQGADEEFIMASHAQRLKMSACFIRSREKSAHSTALKPYKDALTCVTCHNPHVSVKQTGREVFNNACNSCHRDGGKSELACSEPSVKAARAKGKLPTADCSGCHMPSSGSADIPHVSVHDHYIRRPVTTKEKAKIKKFLGLYAVNEEKTGPELRAKAYLSYYEKFEQKSEYLDSAGMLLGNAREPRLIHLYVQLYFFRQQYSHIPLLLNGFGGDDECRKKLLHRPSFENLDAWASYRIAESFQTMNDQKRALAWFQHACALAPFQLDFRNKLASALASAGDAAGAIREFEFILKENPKHVSALSNLGFLRLQQGMVAEARRLYELGLQLDPEYEPLLLNLAGLQIYLKNNHAAAETLRKILRKNPGNRTAKAALQQLQSL